MALLAKRYDLPHVSYLENRDHKLTERAAAAASIYPFYDQGVEPAAYFTEDLGGIAGAAAVAGDAASRLSRPGNLPAVLVYRRADQRSEAAMAPEVKAWFAEKNIALISFRDITQY